MYKIAKIPIEERETLFRNTARKMQVAEAIVEKDFWVCFTLDYLFYKNKWHDCFAFKGGTSLSKAYNIIERFSEDRITIGSASSKQLRNKGVTATLENMPDKKESQYLLSGLRNKLLLIGYNNILKNRTLHLNLDSDYVDIYSKHYTKQLEIAETKLGKGVVSKTFFFDLDLYADVTGVIDREAVHNTNSDYQAEVRITLSKDSEVAKNIIGNNKDYHVIRIHDGELEFVNATMTSDEANYYFTFKSDKFSTYGIYSSDRPIGEDKKYIIPKTGIQ